MLGNQRGEQAGRDRLSGARAIPKKRKEKGSLLQTRQTAMCVEEASLWSFVLFVPAGTRKRTAVGRFHR